MKSRYAAVLAALLVSASPAFAATSFQGILSGANEVPANASTGTGLATVILNNAANQISYTVTYSGLVAPLTASHIHKAPTGVNGGVIIGLSPVVGTTSGTFSGVAAVTPAQVADLTAGLWYINVHSTVFPGGELRAQLLSAPTSTSKSTWGRIKRLSR